MQRYIFIERVLACVTFLTEIRMILGFFQSVTERRRKVHNVKHMRQFLSKNINGKIDKWNALIGVTKKGQRTFA